MAMLYKALIPLAFRGSRVEVGEEFEPTADELANITDIVEPAGETPATEPEPTPEPALADMTVAQLKEKAAELGLSTTGSKADLVERITLHLEGAAGETPAPEEAA